MADQIEQATTLARENTAALRRDLAEAARLGDSFGRTITRAFSSAATQSRDLGSTVRDLIGDLSKSTLRSALKPFQQAIGNGLGSLASNLLGQAAPIPFAQGGVLSAPSTFPLSNGKLGLAGEAGPEAILPLARGSDGRLGVRAGSGEASPLAITFNVSTPDADSFRRSESQIASLLNRAVSRGSRNL